MDQKKKISCKIDWEKFIGEDDNKKEQQRGLEKSETKTNTKKIGRAERIDDTYVFPDEENENKKEVAPNESNKEQEVLTQQKMKNLNLNKSVKKHKGALSNKNFFCFIFKSRQTCKKKNFCILLLWLCLVLFFLFPATYKKAFGIYSGKLEFFFSLVGENTQVIR
ncbi:hypothetical protein RFI_35142 [Reticulomyxa filosa]|uniref:Uncharacterized protein n=1 Tax=Reticulomyxa filosa TaxID=46433 RepID=X6LKZ4_RETFI|nr:hypothetical protein RFI_35142 [Reticulomyxa filosa]|eukprot:ETO02294.1 hypothetical protein RFI_35142 [Reticulomyxa filosa]